MDLAKFVSLLSTRSLFFSRADKFNDPFEGSWPRRNVEGRDRTLRQAVRTSGKGSPEDMIATIRYFGEQYRKWVAINCWHMNEQESAAMWKLYLKSDEGVAIQSTFARLRDSLTYDDDIYAGVVSYIDYESAEIAGSGWSALAAFSHKRLSFEHERELRAVIVKTPPKVIDYAVETMAAGLSVDVDIELLIERVYVAPQAPRWFADVVGSVARSFGQAFEVQHSKMDDAAIF